MGAPMAFLSGQRNCEIMNKDDTTNKLFWTALHRGDTATVEKLLSEGQVADAPLPLGKNSAFAGVLRPLWMVSNLGFEEIAARIRRPQLLELPRWARSNFVSSLKSLRMKFEKE